MLHVSATGDFAFGAVEGVALVVLLKFILLHAKICRIQVASVVAAHLIKRLQLLLAIHGVESSLTKARFGLAEHAHALRVAGATEVGGAYAGPLHRRKLLHVADSWIYSVVSLDPSNLILIIRQLRWIQLIWLRLADHFIFSERGGPVVADANRIVNSLLE